MGPAEFWIGFFVGLLVACALMVGAALVAWHHARHIQETRRG